MVIPIQVGQQMKMGTSYVISFAVDNVKEARDAVPVYASAGGPNKIFNERLQPAAAPLGLAGSVPGDAEPLKLYGNAWAVAEIGQDVPFPSAVNTIHVTLAAWKGLADGTILDISGLKGTTTQSTVSMAVTNYHDGAGPAPFVETGTWIQGSGLARVVTRALNATGLYRFSIQLTNLPFEQASPSKGNEPVVIEARGRIPIQPHS